MIIGFPKSWWVPSRHKMLVSMLYLFWSYEDWMIWGTTILGTPHAIILVNGVYRPTIVNYVSMYLCGFDNGVPMPS
jgi:hypothetical protein